MAPSDVKHPRDHIPIDTSDQRCNHSTSRRSRGTNEISRCKPAKKMSTFLQRRDFRSWLNETTSREEKKYKTSVEATKKLDHRSRRPSGGTKTPADSSTIHRSLVEQLRNDHRISEIAAGSRTEVYRESLSTSVC